ncbi:MAG TPA: EAL domain-containing protein [Chondromyces sp.]|nr:EAL domain-containing protein [Chondromyces sp.]
MRVRLKRLIEQRRRRIGRKNSNRSHSLEKVDNPLLSNEPLSFVQKGFSSQKNLSYLKNQNTHILDRLNIGLWTVEIADTHKVVCYSPGMEVISGYRLDELNTAQLTWESLVYEEDLPAYQKKQEKLLLGHTISHEYRIKHKNGLVKWVHDHTIPTLNEEGEVILLEGMVYDISEKKAVDEKVHTLAYYDELTGLPRLERFRERIDQLIMQHQTEKRFSVIFIDFIRFKQIDETFGHGFGDKVIQKAADKLKKYGKDLEMIARIGRDKFAFLLIEPSKPTIEVTTSIMNEMKKTIAVDGFQFNLSFCAGISTYPVDAKNRKELFNNCETALLRAKEQEEEIQIFSPSMNVRTYKLFQLEKDLRNAIKNREFVLHYQPRVNAHTGEIIGAEALIRWKHPEWGIVYPNDFIGLAEKIGLINDIGDMVIQSVCRTLAKWRKQGLPLVPISVNVSSQRFLKNDFDQYIREALNETRIEPELLEVEITESTMLRSNSAVTRTINALRELGIRIFMDDFGTGYSSIDFLRKSEFIDSIKIDRTFIQNIIENKRDSTIVKSIIQMAHQLGINVVAEGVETEKQLEFLKDIGCKELQGYFFSKPVNMESFTKMLSKRTVSCMLPNIGKRQKAEKRKFERTMLAYPIYAVMKVKQIKNKPLQVGGTYVLIEDIGAGGIRILSHLNIPAREDVLLEFNIHFLGKTRIFNGTVRWKKELGDDFFQYGVQFDLTAEEQQNLAKWIEALKEDMANDCELSSVNFVKTDKFAFLKKIKKQFR